MKSTTNLSLKKIVLLSSGQPSTNPRLVKEADALAGAGYTVVVIYQYWNHWATQFDRELLPQKKWVSIRVGGSHDEDTSAWWFSRLSQKFNILIAKTLGLKFGTAERAAGRAGAFLYDAARKHPADLYIAHNLPALPAAVKAAGLIQAKCGFDAEDYHRNETHDNPAEFDVQLKTYIENSYLPHCNYLTASSQQISDQYQQLFPLKKITTLLNVFPRQHLQLLKLDKKGLLKLFWCSQTIGADRGLEEVIEAMGILKKPIELHMLGQCSADYKIALLKLAAAHGLDVELLHFYQPVLADTIFQFAAGFDIGLATETGMPLNRDICLSNKIFTYLQSGLAIVASDTIAQGQFINDHPSIGLLYAKNDATSLAASLNAYFEDRQLLQETKSGNYVLGQVHLNWETESRKFLSVVEKTLAN